MTITGAVEERVRLSGGGSGSPIYDLVLSSSDSCGIWGGVVLDAGCGDGALSSHISGRFDRYTGIDVVHYDFKTHA